MYTGKQNKNPVISGYSQAMQMMLKYTRYT